jgi:predicted small lipoprotein YifL
LQWHLHHLFFGDFVNFLYFSFSFFSMIGILVGKLKNAKGAIIMKTMKKYLLSALAVLLCLLTLWGCGKKAPQEDPADGEQTPQQNQQQEEQQQTPVILSDTIECSNGSRTLRFQRNAKGNWEWKDDPEFPLNDTYVKELLTTFETMLTLEPIATDKTLKALALEEDDTSKYITASNEKGESVTWYLGKKNDDGSYYMRLADDKTFAIFLSPGGLHTQISRSIYAMMELPQLPAISAENLTSLSLRSGDVTHQFRTDADGRWYDSENNNVTDKMQPLLHQLSAPAVAACVDFKPSKGAPAICGLDKPKAVLTVEYTDKLENAATFTLYIGNIRESGYFVTINDDSTIYRMDAPLVNAVLAFVQ